MTARADLPTFDGQLKVGKAGEAFLVQHHKAFELAPQGEYRWDLLGGRAERIEVKTDTYSPTKTTNFFMEQRTRVHGGHTLLGGPWRALDEGVDTFVYLFHRPEASPSTAYWFYDIPALVQHLDKHLAEYQVRRVRNARVTAVGLLVPRDSLKALYTKEVIHHAKPKQ